MPFNTSRGFRGINATIPLSHLFLGPLDSFTGGFQPLWPQFEVATHTRPKVCCDRLQTGRPFSMTSPLRRVNWQSAEQQRDHSVEQGYLYTSRGTFARTQKRNNALIIKINLSVSWWLPFKLKTPPRAGVLARGHVWPVQRPHGPRRKLPDVCHG